MKHNKQQHRPRLPKNPHTDLILACLHERAARPRMLASEEAAATWLEARDRYLAEYAKWEQRELAKRIAQESNRRAER